MSVPATSLIVPTSIDGTPVSDLPLSQPVQPPTGTVNTGPVRRPAGNTIGIIGQPMILPSAAPTDVTGYITPPTSSSGPGLSPGGPAVSGFDPTLQPGPYDYVPAAGSSPTPPTSSPAGGSVNGAQNNPAGTPPPLVENPPVVTLGAGGVTPDNTDASSLIDLLASYLSGGQTPSSTTVGSSGGVAQAAGTPTIDSGDSGGAAIDPATGLQIDPSTGYDIDPATGEDIIPSTAVGSSDTSAAAPTSLLQSPAVIWGIRIALLVGAYFLWRHFHHGKK